MSATVANTLYTGELVAVAVSCGECGIVFGMPSDFRAKRLGDHQFWHCPNGHERRFVGQTEAQRYKALYEQEQRRLESARRDADHQREQRQAEERRVRSLRGVITRTKRRVAHGVCPCCTRTFRDLARHMEGKHPDYVKTAAEAPVTAS